MQTLSKRLQALADFVTPGSRIADSGTDHGSLPSYLVQSGRCPKAIAMDVQPGPLQRASMHIAAEKLEPYIETRLSFGLDNLQRHEADSVVIAGMGGSTLMQILGQALDKLFDMGELILGPQSDLEKVRKFLREHHIYIDKEELILEDGKFYPILHAVTSQSAQENGKNYIRLQALLEKLSPLGIGQQMLDRYGTCLILGGHPLLWKQLEQEERQKQEILWALDKNTIGEKGALRRRELETWLAGIRVLKKEMQKEAVY